MATLQNTAARSTPSVTTAQIAVLVIAVANGLSARVIEAWRDGTASGLVPGVSPFELLALVVGLTLLAARSSTTDHRLGWPEVATGLMLLVPSSTVAWAGASAYAALIARTERGDRRTGALLICALSVAAVWSSLGVRLVSGPVTTYEAGLVSLVLAAVDPDLIRTGNVIGRLGGHHLVILPACTSAEALPRALVAMAALAHFAGARDVRRIAVAAGLGAFAFVAANTARLAFMATSSDAYAFAHGPTGASLFDGIQVSIVLAVAFWASRR